MREINRSTNTYVSKLLKLIPTEIVAAYLFISNLVPDSDRAIGMSVIAGFLFLCTPLFLWKIHKVKTFPQLAVSSISFIVWCYAMGSPFVELGIHVSWVASAILFMWTSFVPLIFKENGK